MTTAPFSDRSGKSGEFGRPSQSYWLAGIAGHIFCTALAGLFAATWYVKFKPYGLGLLPVAGGAIGFLVGAVQTTRFMQRGRRPRLVFQEDRIVLTALWRDRSIAWAEVTKVSTGKGGNGDEIVIAAGGRTMRITAWELNRGDDIASLVAFIRTHIPKSCQDEMVEFLGTHC